ncbi:PGC-1 and ERR-induced regulator in muscle protein 1 isoform X2 [Hyperolius riggenbachi]|uniref:PGC-1 and ERR-induced regulator in muscle protein 1 isoform X2 n=1 Tax=Hyperolius riggenbachi TaxID=752182 RepID=UPI0035A38C8B
MLDGFKLQSAHTSLDLEADRPSDLRCKWRKPKTDGYCEPGLIKSEAHMAGAEGIVYTPDMYDYFFVDDDDNTTKKKDCASEEPSTNVELAPAPSVEASWPEACEFFFADGPQDQNRGGILLSIPSSQAQRVSRIFQSIVPDGLKEFTVKGGCLDRDGKPIRYHSHGISEETNIATTVLLANIGAISAIRYLRRHRKRRESSLQPLPET